MTIWQHRTIKTLGAVLAAILPVTLAAVALSSLLPYLAWVLYSAALSKLTGAGLLKCIKEDAKTYLAMLLLFLMPLTKLAEVPQGLERFSYLPAAVIYAAAIGLFLAIKAYFLAGYRAKAFETAKRIVQRITSSDKTIYVAVAVYIVLLASMSIAKHHAFNTKGVDLGIFDQTLWGLTNGVVSFSTVVGDYLFAHHSFFLFFPLALLYKLAPNVELLLALQSVVIGLGALPLYWLAKKKLGRNIAIFVAVIYLIYPSLNYINLEDFHIETFAATTILFSFYFLEEKRTKWFLAMIALTALIKEDTPLTAAAIGLYAIIFKRMLRQGAAAIAVSIAIFLLATQWFIPNFSEASQFEVQGLGTFGKTVPEIVKNVLLNPFSVVALLIKAERLAYMVMLLLPLGGLSILAPEVFIGALPALAANLLSDVPQRHTIFFHYSANVIPFMFIALIYGLDRSRRITSFVARKASGISMQRLNHAVIAFLAATALLTAYFYGPMPGAKGFTAETYNFNSDDAKAARQLTKLIPPTASVSATNNAVPHLSQRETIFTFPNPFHRTWYITDKGRAEPEYVLLNLIPGKEGIYTSEEFATYVTELINNRGYGIIAKENQWLLFKRGANYEKGICDHYAEIRKGKFINAPLASENSNIIGAC
ncbi:DUF2079 domain-containing protein [Candidatus Woesearchaeota archaeon]|nr:DUF2079 domain-containing protein [Candidatus Woesearchaeota archaeon]